MINSIIKWYVGGDIFKAIENNNTIAVRALIALGADLSVQNTDGLKPLGWAIYNNKSEIVKLLVKAGVDLESPIKCIDNKTPLEFALARKNTKIAKIIFEAISHLETEQNFIAHWSQRFEEQIGPKLKLQSEEFMKEDTDILNIKEKMQNLIKLKKKDSGLNFSVIKAKKTNDLYAIYNPKLGSGAYGKVKLVQNLDSKLWSVVKISKKIYSAKQEKEILKFQNLLDGHQKTENKYYLFMPYIHGMTLGSFIQSVLQNKEKLDLDLQKKLLHSILKSFEVLIDKKIHHSDLHSDNFMFNPLTWEVNIIDFGMARTFESLDKMPDNFYTAFDILNTLKFKLIIDAPELRDMIDCLSKSENRGEALANILENTLKALQPPHKGCKL